MPIAGSIEVQMRVCEISQVTSKLVTLKISTMRTIEAAQTLFVPCQSQGFLTDDICTYKNPSKKIPVKVIFWVLFV